MSLPEPPLKSSLLPRPQITSLPDVPRKVSLPRVPVMVQRGSGGGLTAGLALLARDRGEVGVAFQAPIYPMIDDRNATPSGQANASSRIWSRRYNENGWRAYVGENAGGEDVSPYAAATRAGDLSGLPPAYIAVGTLDVFLDEDIEYARRLVEAGVLTELHVYPGLFHGSDIFVPTAASSVRFVADRNAALRRALHPETAPLPG